MPEDDTNAWLPDLAAAVAAGDPARALAGPADPPPPLPPRPHPPHAGEAQEPLRRLADDANWEVREWAGSAAGEVAALHFAGFYPVLQRWAADPSQFVRRAVCIAALRVPGRRGPAP